MSTITMPQMARPASEPDESTWHGRVAVRLRALRLLAKLDVERAAVAITKAGYEIAPPTLYKWEQGRSTPNLDALPAVAKAYGVPARSVIPKE